MLTYKMPGSINPIASMGPRSGERGNGGTDSGCRAKQLGFNGAALR